MRISVLHLRSAAFRLIGVLHHKRGRTSRAHECAQTALSHNPRNFRNLRLLAQLEYRLGKYGSALELVASAMEIRPGDDRMRRLFERTLVRTSGHFDDALRAFRLTYRTKIPPTHVVLALTGIGIASSRFDDAKSLLINHRQYVGEHTLRKDAHAFAHALAEAGEVEMARKLMEIRFPHARAEWEWRLSWFAGNAADAHKLLLQNWDHVGAMSDSELTDAANLSTSVFALDLAADIAAIRVRSANPGTSAEFAALRIRELEAYAMAGRTVAPAATLRIIATEVLQTARQSGYSNRDVLKLARAFLQRFDPATALALSERLPTSAPERDEIDHYVTVVRGVHPDFHAFYDFAVEEQASGETGKTLECDILFAIPWNSGTHFVDGSAAVERASMQVIYGRAFALARKAGLSIGAIPAPARRLPQEAAGPHICVSFHTFGGENVRHVKLGSIPGAMLIDAQGYSGWASGAGRTLANLPLSDIDIATARAWFDKERRGRMASNLSKYAQESRRNLDRTRGHAVFCALQIPGDTVQRLAFVPMFDYFRSIVEGWRDTGTTVYIKRHPRCRDPRTTAFLRWAADQAHVRITQASIYDLFAVVDAVYVVNSGVGAEALLQGLPVHVSGKTDYRHACHEHTDLTSMVFGCEALRPKLDEDTLIRYLWWYVNIYHLAMDDLTVVDERVMQMIVAPALALRDKKTNCIATPSS